MREVTPISMVSTRMWQNWAAPPSLEGWCGAECWMAARTAEASEGVRYDETMASRRVDRASSASAEVCGAVCSHVGSRDRICCCCSASASAAVLSCVCVWVSPLVSSSNEKLVVGSRKFRLLLLVLLVLLEVPPLTNGAARCTKAWDGRSRASRATAAAALRRWLALPLALLPDIGAVIDTAGAVEVPLRGRLLPAGDGGRVGPIVGVVVGINIASVDMGEGGSVVVVAMPMTAVGEGRHKNIIWDEMRNEVWKTKEDMEGSKQEEGGNRRQEPSTLAL